MTKVVRSVFQEDNKYYPQVFLDECLYELHTLEYNRIDVSEGIDINRANGSKECDICHYWYFIDIGFKYKPYLIITISCNDCHDLIQKAMNFNNVAIVFVKGSDYRIHFCYMSQDDAITIMKNSNLYEKVGHYKIFSLYIKMGETTYYQRNREQH